MNSWSVNQLRECSRPKLLGLLRESAGLLAAGGVLAVPAVQWDPESSDEVESKAAHRLSFLLLSYTPPFWYWELVELSRKFFTACATVFVWRRNVRQVAVVLAVTFLALLATMRLRPYRSRSVLNTQIFSLFVQCTTLLYGLMIRAIEATEDSSAEEEGQTAYTVLLALFCMVPAFPLLLATSRRVRTACVRRTLALPADDGEEAVSHDSPANLQPVSHDSPANLQPSNPPSESVRPARHHPGSRAVSGGSIFSQRSTVGDIRMIREAQMLRRSLEPGSTDGPVDQASGTSLSGSQTRPERTISNQLSDDVEGGMEGSETEMDPRTGLEQSHCAKTAPKIDHNSPAADQSTERVLARTEPEGIQLFVLEMPDVDDTAEDTQAEADPEDQDAWE
eukprot:1862486-Rhodomonas_salina.1